MTLRTLDAPKPIAAVLFDFHSTLVDQGDAKTWLELAWRRAGLEKGPEEGLGPDGHARLIAWLDRIWEHAREVDPHNDRDRSMERHRRVFDAVVQRAPVVDGVLANALYDVMLEPWVAYEDAVPTLQELKRRGMRVGIISNIGLDVRPVLERTGLNACLDAAVLSYEVGLVKPDPRIFALAAEKLGAEPDRVLMVGDSAPDDAGGAAIGMRTLILPRTRGPLHGLELVARLVGA